jgi:hypothetical protein
MKELTFKLNRNEFIPWILSEYDKEEIIGLWCKGESIEECAICCAGEFPTRYIENWEEIQHLYTEEEQQRADENWCVEYIPDDLEVEWIYEEQDNE